MRILITTLLNKIDYILFSDKYYVIANSNDNSITLSRHMANMLRLSARIGKFSTDRMHLMSTSIGWTILLDHPKMRASTFDNFVSPLCKDTQTGMASFKVKYPDVCPDIVSLLQDNGGLINKQLTAKIHCKPIISRNCIIYSLVF